MIRDKIVEFNNYFYDILNEVKKLKYDVAKNNISIYFFEEYDFINCYIIPNKVCFKFKNKQDFLNYFKNQVIEISNLNIADLDNILINLVKKYNLNFTTLSFSSDDNKNYLLSSIKSNEELSTGTNIFLYYDNSLIKMKKYN